MSVATTRAPALAMRTAARPAPRQTKRRMPSSLFAKDPPEVEAQRLLQLGTRPGRGLRVLERVEVELEGHALLLHAVELRGEPAALVGLGEDELRPREGAVVPRELLDRLDEDPLDVLGLPRGDRGERRGQANLRHRSTP